MLIFLARSKTRRIQTITFTLLILAVGLNVASDTYTTVAGRGTIERGSDYFENLYGNDFQNLMEMCIRDSSSRCHSRKRLTAPVRFLNAENFLSLKTPNTTS